MTACPPHDYARIAVVLVIRSFIARLTGRQQPQAESAPSADFFTEPDRPAGALVVGHSHIIAMQGAADLLRDAGEARHLRFIQLLDADHSPNVEPGPAGMTLASALRERLDTEIAAAAGPALFQSISGNEYHFIGLVNHPRRFDFVLPSAPHLPIEPDAEIIPFDLMHAGLKNSMEYALVILACLRRVTKLPIWHIQSPPPVPSNAEIAAHPQQFGDAIASHGVAPPFLRLKLWRLQSEIYRNACVEHGISFMAVPEAALDADGFMRPEGWHQDPTHANYWYGRLVLDQIEDILASQFKAQSKPA